MKDYYQRNTLFAVNRRSLSLGQTPNIDCSLSGLLAIDWLFAGFTFGALLLGALLIGTFLTSGLFASLTLGALSFGALLIRTFGLLACLTLGAFLLVAAFLLRVFLRAFFRVLGLLWAASLLTGLGSFLLSESSGFLRGLLTSLALGAFFLGRLLTGLTLRALTRSSGGHIR